MLSFVLKTVRDSEADPPYAIRQDLEKEKSQRSIEDAGKEDGVARSLADAALLESKTASDYLSAIEDNVIKVEQRVESLELDPSLQNISATVHEVQGSLEGIDDRVAKIESDTSIREFQNSVPALQSAVEDLEYKLAALELEHDSHRRIDDARDAQTLSFAQQLGLAVTGNLVLQSALGEEDVSKAELEAAAAGEYVKYFTAQLASSTGGASPQYFAHEWATFAPVVSSAEAVGDVDVSAPTVEDVIDSANPVVFRSGALSMAVIFDTDAGSTKNYEVGESVTVTIKVASDDKLLGFTVAELVKTYNVIA